MTPQEIFNKAYIGVVRQGKASTKVDGRCAYRGKNGTACGIGHLIDDKTAGEWDKMADSSIAGIIEGSDDRESLPAWVPDNADLLVDIQRAHDDSKDYSDADEPELTFVEFFIEDMVTIAAKYNLEIPVV